ncbi:MAG: hypothetical protein OXC71_03175 [Chloroflexi bacterium]|nr:hypothetical protein [Chloroflexota bacterium]
MVRDVTDWLAEHMLSGKPLYATRLPYSGPGSPEAEGLFIPRQVVARVAPRVFWVGKVNPSEPIEMSIDSHPHSQTIEAVWFNSEHHGGDQNETRLVGFDPESVLADPESTGALVMFAFQPARREEPARSRVWMCESAAEEDIAETRIGPVDRLFGGALWPHIFERLDRPHRSYV